MIKVLLLGPLPPPVHGVSRYTEHLYASLLGPSADAAFEYRMLNSSDRQIDGRMGQWTLQNLQQGLRVLAELWIVLVRWQPDIFYFPLSQNVPAFMRDGLFVLAARIMGAKVVAHLHGGYLDELYRTQARSPRWTACLFRSFWKIVCTALDRMIILSERFIPVVAAHLAVEKITIVPNAIPNNAGAIRKNIERKHLAILHLGLLCEAKGTLELLTAFERLAAKYEHIELHLAGPFSEDPEDRTHTVWQRISSLPPFAGRMRYHGIVHGIDKIKLLYDSDIFCLPTHYRYEGQPLALLEAMQAGLAVISTRHAAIPDLVTDPCGILLAPSIVPEDLERALSALIEDKETRERLGRSAMKRAGECFAWSQAIERLKRIWRETAH